MKSFETPLLIASYGCALAFSICVLAGCNATPKAVTVLSVPGQMTNIIVTPDALYVRQKNSLASALLKAGKDGDSVETIRASENLSEGPVIDGDNFCWTGYAQEVYCKPINATLNVQAVQLSNKTLKPSSPVPGYIFYTAQEFRDLLEGKRGKGRPTTFEFTSDVNQFYLTVTSAIENEFVLISISKKDGNPQALARGKFLAHVKVDSTNIYFSAYDEVYSLKKDATEPPSVLYKGARIRSNLAVDDSFLYFVSARSLVRIPKEGGGPEILDGGEGINEHQEMQAVSLDSENVYWSVSGTSESYNEAKNDGKILKIPKRGGKRTTLESSLGLIPDMKVDSGQIYWVSCFPNKDKCDLMTRAK
jgi:hypothetical protein